jgi:hypothetical protein
MTPESSPNDENDRLQQIQYSAEIFIEKYGDDAPRQAELRANELLATGNSHGGNLWISIYVQIQKMLNDA